jgi:4-aminobutyrate aminotransferase-like enzyme
LYLRIEFILDCKTKQPAGAMTGWMVNELVNEGLICMHSGDLNNRMGFTPPLVITRDEIDRVLVKFDHVIG